MVILPNISLYAMKAYRTRPRL